MSDCLNCPTGPLPGVPIDLPQFAIPGLFAEPSIMAEEGGDATMCNPTSPEVCGTGFAPPTVWADFIAPDVGDTVDMTTSCGGLWAEIGQTVKTAAGLFEVVAITDQAVTLRNISAAPGAVIARRTRLWPITSIPAEDDPRFVYGPDDLEDATEDGSIWFPVLTKSADGKHRWGFKRSLTGIPVETATEEELALGASILVHIRPTNTIRRMPPPPPTFEQPILGYSAVAGKPVWRDGMNADKVVLRYTGQHQQVTIPEGKTRCLIKCWGAGGARSLSGSNAPSPRGGGGGFSQCAVNVTPGSVLSVIVGRGSVGRPTANYGFGGLGGSSMHVYNNPGGAGLSGVFQGSAAVAEGDAARALCVAGGGSGGSIWGGPNAWQYRDGGGGNDQSQSQPTMKGLDSNSSTLGGGGGGGINGGARGKGGKGKADGDDSKILAGSGIYAGGRDDDDYITGVGGEGQNGAVVLRFLD